MRNAIKVLQAVKTAILIIVCVIVPRHLFAETEHVSSVRIALLPFAPLNIDEDETEIIATMINRRLSTSFFVESFDDVKEALDDVDCDEKEQWADRTCIQETGEELEVGFVLAGSISRIGNVIVTDAALHNIGQRAPVWSKQYKIEGTLDSYLLSVPQRIAEDVTGFLGAGVRKTGGPYAVTNAPVMPVADNGIVKGPTIGLHGLFALGTVNKRQSQASVKVMYLHPTKENAHLRVTAGIPTFYTENNKFIDEKKYDDFQICLEHEWGWKKAGVSAGLMYSNLALFSGPDAEDTYSGYSANNIDTLLYDTYHSVNVVVSLRGGGPSGCFHGRISFPLAIMQQNRYENGVFEYSIFGVFGGRATKVGIGNMGHFTRRTPDRLVMHDTTLTMKQYKTQYIDYNPRFGEIIEFYRCLPALKIAHLFGEHIVANLTVELGGIIIPRLRFDEWVRPSMGFDFVYSFGKLQGPNVMDGTF